MSDYTSTELYELDDEDIKYYKDKHTSLIRQSRAICQKGYKVYLDNHLTSDMSEDDFLDMCWEAAYRYPLCYEQDTKYDPYTFNAEMDFLKDYTPPMEIDNFKSLYSRDEDKWLEVINRLETVLDQLRFYIKEDIMTGYEGLEEVIYIGNHGNFSANSNKLFPSDIPLAKIETLKRTAEHYYQNEHWWASYPINNLDPNRMIFYSNIVQTLQNGLRKSSKADEKSERKKLIKELDDFIK